MIDTPHGSASDVASTTPARAGARNTYQTGLAVVAGFAWFMAFILWLTLAQVTDYTIYNVDDAAALEWWINTLVFTGIATTIGCAVIAGVRRELRSVDRV